MMRRAVALAPAKINIGLEVTGRRSDGFHNIVSILQVVSLFDRLEWSESAGTYSYESPPGIDAASDLARAALDLAGDRSGWSGQLRLHKGIPVAAGLGGGSSDAALALKVAFPEAGIESMNALAVPLGSDVPFFLEGGTALVTGAGTDLEPLPHLDAWCVIVTPWLVIPNKTRALYAALTIDDYSDGNRVRRIAQSVRDQETIDVCPPNAFARHLMEHQEIRAARAALHVAGAAWVSVSGAGPSLYTLVKDYREARTIANRVPAATGEIFVTRTLPRRYRHLSAENLANLLRRRLPPR